MIVIVPKIPFCKLDSIIIKNGSEIKLIKASNNNRTISINEINSQSIIGVYHWYFGSFFRKIKVENLQPVSNLNFEVKNVRPK